MSYIDSRGQKWEGAVPDENMIYLTCEVCGSKHFRKVSNFDGRDFYGITYNCENGHCINMYVKRWGAYTKDEEGECQS